MTQPEPTVTRLDKGLGPDGAADRERIRNQTRRQLARTGRNDRAEMLGLDSQNLKPTGSKLSR